MGVDVGTTTTQIVLSRLGVHNARRPGLVPRLEIDQREVLYQGDPQRTPLLSSDVVDADSLVRLVKEQIGQSGVDPLKIETGAVIITGETARTKNADAILKGIAQVAGDFIVTVAGPNLEAQIAARGSGAAAWSLQNYASIINVDVGGGSANAALFRLGKHLSSSAIMVGGRQAVIDRETKVLEYLPPPARVIIQAEGIDGLVVGQEVAVASLKRFTDAMADAIVDLASGLPCRYRKHVELSQPLDIREPVDAYTISGGIGSLYYKQAFPRTLEEIARYGDVGPLLARSLHENARWRSLRVIEPLQTQYATVLGAAGQQVTLSGSTIWVDPGQLPLRNLPVIELAVTGFESSEDIAAAIATSVQHREGDGPVFALALSCSGKLSYENAIELGKGIVFFRVNTESVNVPTVILIEQDYAKILGQIIKGLNEKMTVVVIDQVGLQAGDFIDIGKPMFDGRIVPISVKTLVFYQ